jgi:signal-transduction protein with cAMP-binding, CBS, and nucleotidyltransferase domain
MTLIMQNLEVRLFKKGEIIYQELDEAHEVLFVFSGRYNVGYEMNKIRRYRKQFGPSTIIGGF